MAQTRMLLLAVFFSFGAASASVTKKTEEKSYYLLPQKVYNLAKSMSELNLEMIESRDGFTLVKLSHLSLDQLSKKIHNDLGTCGGFFDVTDEYTKAAFKKLDFSSYAEKPASHFVDTFSKRAISHKDLIVANFNHVKKERFSSSLQQFVQFPNRAARSQNGADASAWLVDKVRDYAKAAGRTDVTVEAIKTGARYKQDSVVAKIPGQSITSKGGALIGGHMDTLSWGNMPGADDDATGTISTLEIFRGILDSGLRFKNDLYFAFYAAEEVGLVGSKVVANTFKSRGIELQGVFQLDMTGYLSSQETNELYFIKDYTTSSLNEWTRRLAVEVVGLPAGKVRETSCGYACSDQASWNRQGYATVFPFESSFDNHNRSIHSDEDGIHKINFDHAMKFVKLGFAFMVELGEPNQ